jgi:hypothetical protein
MARSPGVFDPYAAGSTRFGRRDDRVCFRRAIWLRPSKGRALGSLSEGRERLFLLLSLNNDLWLDENQ